MTSPLITTSVPLCMAALSQSVEALAACMVTYPLMPAVSVSVEVGDPSGLLEHQQVGVGTSILSEVQPQEEGINNPRSFPSCGSLAFPGMVMVMLDDLAHMRGQLHDLYRIKVASRSHPASPLVTGFREVPSIQGAQDPVTGTVPSRS